MAQKRKPPYRTQMINAKASIRILSEKLMDMNTYEDVQAEINRFCIIALKDANEKNNRPNKYMMGVINYLKEV